MNEFNSNSDKVNTPCIECKENISKGASVCVHCASYQKEWKNRLKYLANIIAVFVVSGTFLLWSFSMLPKVRKILFFKDDVRIVGLSSIGNTVIGNFGDGPIYLSHVLIEYPKINPKYRQISSRVEFLELLQPGSFSKVPTMKKKLGDKYLFHPFKYNEKDPNEMIEKAVREIDCYRIAFFHEDDFFYKDIKEQYKNTISVNSHGYIAYYTSRDDQLKIKPIDVLAVVVQLDSISCIEDIPPNKENRADRK
jgi:hypothetical protein